MMNADIMRSKLDKMISSDLKPYVRRIDREAYYANHYLKGLGREGFFSSVHKNNEEIRLRSVKVLEETSEYCMTTGFNLWCHQALLTYIRLSDNKRLKSELLRPLENGTLLGGTGLSNPMKFYAEIDDLYLKAERVNQGYVISGNLPMVSNLGEDHWFAIIACTGQERVMAVVPCAADGLKMVEQLGFLGLNGSATYACQFRNVFIPDDWILSENADEYIKVVRSTFILYQVPLGLGVTAASLHAMKQVKDKQAGCNRYLPVQPEQLEEELLVLSEKTRKLAGMEDLDLAWPELLKVRLEAVYLTLNAVQACMLHQGSPGYALNSHPSRRLREAYFFANLTPTVRHLEKMTRKA